MLTLITHSLLFPLLFLWVVSFVLLSVCKQAHLEGIARAPKPLSDEAQREIIRDRMWEPKYPSMVRVDSMS